MKTSLLAICLCLVASLTFAQDDKKEEKKDEKGTLKVVKPGLETLDKQFAYTVGANIGRNFRRQGIELEVDAFIKGLKTALSDGDLSLSPTEMEEVFEKFEAVLREREVKRRKELGEKNLKEGAEFLAANKKKKGVKTTSTGLQYLVIKEGTGERPTGSDTVVTHYRGTLIDGTIFDATYQGKEPTEKDRPATFGVNQVIPGRTEALKLMTVGAKYRLFIPSTLAYDARGQGRDIGPNATLIFEIELVKIQ